MKVYQTVVAIIYDKNEEYNFLILKKKGRWVGWQFVQGAREKGESFEQAVKREVAEETGLDDVSVIAKLPVWTDYWYREKGVLVHKFCSFYLVKADKSRPIKLSVEHSDYKWCDFRTAYKLLKFNKEQLKKAFDFLIKTEKAERKEKE